MISVYLALLLFINCIGALKVGVGIHDCTGPAGGVNFMGYAQPEQITQGVHNRLYARCYVFTDDGDAEDAKRFVYCSADVPMISQNVKQGVIDLLVRDFGVLYTHKNVLLSATHTHAGPGGFHEYLIYSVTSFGYISETAEAMIAGIYGAIVRAHNNMADSQVSVATGLLFGANRNRSPTSYAMNPQEERDLYAEEGDTDKIMTLVKITDAATGHDRGLINWFSVHCTSMNNTNDLVSGDNKGYASYLMEKFMNRPHLNDSSIENSYSSDRWAQMRGDGSFFVAAFGQTNEGDSSPNIEGAFCLDTGEPCDLETSTCPGRNGKPKNELCHARGPGWENGGDKESTRVIGLRQFAKAFALYSQANESLTGPVDFAHAWVDMSNVTVGLKDGSTVKTCLPARGYSFAAGTTDGPGAFDFKQGDNSTGNRFWNFIRSFISTPSEGQQKCHSPKPILLNTGEATFPYPWEPTVIDIQIMRVGSLLILAVPAEFTTMAGRRLRRAVKNIFVPYEPSVRVVIAGLSNSYSGYVSTYEEYQAQRYESASTIYGPRALDAYIQEFERLAWSMVPDKTSMPVFPAVSHDPEIPPTSFTNRLLSFLPPVLFDAVPLGRRFGEIVPGKDVRPVYQEAEWAEAVFFSGHPRNRFVDPLGQLEVPFLLVEKYVGPSLDEIQTEISNWMLSYGMKHKYHVVVEPDLDRNFLRAKITQSGSFLFQKLGLIPKDNEELLVYSVDGKAHVSVLEQDLDDVAMDELWITIRDDNDWDTEFHWWKPVVGVSPISYAKVRWQVSTMSDDGTNHLGEKLTDGMSVKYDQNSVFRFRYKGHDKSPAGRVLVHEGVSATFRVGTASGSNEDSKSFHEFSV